MGSSAQSRMVGAVCIRVAELSGSAKHLIIKDLRDLLFCSLDWILRKVLINSMALIPVAISLPALTPVCLEERPKMVPSITGRPLICQSATSSTGEKPVVAKPPPNLCFRFLFAKIGAHVSQQSSHTAECKKKYWIHLPHCTMFLYLILTCCQVRFTLLGLAL